MVEQTKMRWARSKCHNVIPVHTESGSLVLCLWQNVSVSLAVAEHCHWCYLLGWHSSLSSCWASVSCVWPCALFSWEMRSGSVFCERNTVFKVDKAEDPAWWLRDIDVQCGVTHLMTLCWQLCHVGHILQFKDKVMLREMVKYSCRYQKYFQKGYCFL